VIVAFCFITRAIAQTEPNPRIIGLPGGREIATTMKDIHGASMVSITVAFLAAPCGALIMRCAQSADRRLVVAGFRPGRRSCHDSPSSPSQPPSRRRPGRRVWWSFRSEQAARSARSRPYGARWLVVDAPCRSGDSAQNHQVESEERHDYGSRRRRTS
jgi:hypothetical protein